MRGRWCLAAGIPEQVSLPGTSQVTPVYVYMYARRKELYLKRGKSGYDSPALEEKRIYPRPQFVLKSANYSFRFSVLDLDLLYHVQLS